jgi:ATP-dependent helicase HrpA
LTEAARGSEVGWMRNERRHSWTIRYPEELPIVSHKDAIVGLLQREQVVVVAGETGSGKTTQLPKMCLEAGIIRHGRLACTQPRRVAALSISRRIAEELGVEWGHEVGAKIRFTDRTRPETVIKVMTDGMLLTEIRSDRMLRGYDAIIIDEAHERSLNIDFLLGYLKQLLSKRPDLKLIITSATIDTAAFSRAFNDAPIVEVSGRLYPVETIYAPVDELLEDSGETSYIEAVAKSVEEIVSWNREGDVLVFLPGEKDIREVRELLDGRGLRLDVLPLFGRLSSAEQERIFQRGRLRKVVLATNIAETSITIPGIRYVVDSGLARISRYSAHTHTRRLPIEKIAQSSAEQRKGRAGRLSDGVCIRLYSEQDYAARPRFATPEILRSNLADVILRMIALKLGDIRDFPFIEPPAERSIRSGYLLLEELGALDAAGGLSEIGEQLSRLPVDPTVGRMLIEANREGCVAEVLVIAAALSIQDPRERPMDAAQAADEMHRRFRHEESDFLTLLSIWQSYHDEMERLSQAKLRKFCREHFLSYLRMREWRDIHAQLSRVLEELRGFRINAEPAHYDQIHRALLSGLLNGVARHEEGNQYKGTRNRNALIFPGSGLFNKQVSKARHKGKKAERVAAARVKAPAWILCAEFMETTRLYARTVARIDPAWIVRLCGHVLKSKYTEPWYEESSERVLVRERILLYGLEVAVKSKGYVRINAADATEIFIREALVGGRLKTRAPFHEHNQQLLEQLQDRQTRMRVSSGWMLEERLYRFYRDKIERVGSLADLNAFTRDRHGGDPHYLFASEEDLLEAQEEGNLAAFPDAVQINGVDVPLAYAYKPGDEDDGATLRIPVEAFENVDAAAIDWTVPGLIRGRIEHLLRGLPKETRKTLFPMADVVEELALAVRPGEGALVDQLARLLLERRKLRLKAGDFQDAAVPGHLRPRVELVDREQRTVAAGRDWSQLREQYQAAVHARFAEGEGKTRLQLWQRACARYEQADVRPDALPELPEVLTLGDVAGLPVRAYAGLQLVEGAVALRLFSNRAEAAAASAGAWPALIQAALGRELGWFERDLARELKRVALGFADLLDGAQLRQQSSALLLRYLCELPQPLPIQPARMAALKEQASTRMRGLPQLYVDQLEQIASRRHTLRRDYSATRLWMAELDALVHPRFLNQISWQRLQSYPRYLDALALRAQRARGNPQRDAEKAARIAPLVQRYAQLKAPPATRRRLRWLIEEFKVQVFAQELGTAEKVSLKIIEEAFAEAEAG